jgi:hypothetical protein
LLGAYLAGLIEGDGNIWVSKRLLNSAGKIISPVVSICFALKDRPLAEALIKSLGMGYISEIPGKNALYLRIAGFANLYKLVLLIGPDFRTDKISQLHALVVFLRARGYIIQDYVIDLSALASNAWLSGFIEADGSFQIRASSISGSSRIACTFELVQAVIPNSYSFNL